MARLSEVDRRSVEDLRSSLAVFREGERALPTVVDSLRVLLRADRALAYSVRAAEEGFDLAFGYWSGFGSDNAALNARVSAGLATARGPWALFNPYRIEKRQRDAVVCIPEPRRLGDAIRSLAKRLGARDDDAERLNARMARLNRSFLPRIGLSDLAVCRALVCHNERLLTWIGVARNGDFGAREQMMLTRLLPALQRRLRVETSLEQGELSLAALAVTLERLGRPAIILCKQRVVHANQRGRELARSADLVDSLLRGGAAGWELVAIASDGMAPHTLALGPSASRSTDVIAMAARRWSLTRRQVEILSAVVDGASTKQIGDRFGISTRTVELQLTALFSRASVSGRTGLVSAIWRLAE